VVVSLVNGLFQIGNQILHASEGDVADLSYKENVKYRLIYATRHSCVGGCDHPDFYTYLVGWQYTENGKNVKRILYVQPNGEVIFGGE